MVGWLKHFVKTRALPGESLIKGYTIHMLARRAPTCLVHDFEARRPTYGKDMALRGKLKQLSTMLTEQEGKPGCGLVYVALSRRNRRVRVYDRLPLGFRRCFYEYNAAARQSDRFTRNIFNIEFLEIIKGNIHFKCHTINQSPQSFICMHNKLQVPVCRSTDDRSRWRLTAHSGFGIYTTGSLFTVTSNPSYSPGRPGAS